MRIQFIPLFISYRYDVWLVDWRASCDLPWAVYQDYSLDDCATYDYPAAIDKVLEITKQVFLLTKVCVVMSLSFEMGDRKEEVTESPI